MHDLPEAVKGIPGDVASGTGTSASVVYGGILNRSHVVSGIFWSYTNDPAGGNIRIDDGIDDLANTIFNTDIIKGGAGFFHFDPPKKGTPGKPMKITISSGGSGVTGKISVEAHWAE